MRCLVLVALVGCGRFGFGEGAPVDAALVDVAIDTAPDAAGADTVFYLSFDDDPSDGLVDDTSGHGFGATCVAGISCPTQIAGKRGMGLSFNGTSEYALIQHQPGLVTSTLTVALWVYLDAVARDQVAIGKPVGSGSSDSWALVAWSDTQMMTCFETTNPVAAQEWACGPAVLPTGSWFHLAGVWDGPMKHIYINGTRAASVAATGILFDAQDIVLGGDRNAGSFVYGWQGRLDELRVYDRALMQAEIMALAAP